MKQRWELSEDDIREALREYIERKTGAKPKDVHLQYHNYDGSRDPRERSYFTATVTEG